MVLSAWMKRWLASSSARVRSATPCSSLAFSAIRSPGEGMAISPGIKPQQDSDRVRATPTVTICRPSSSGIGCV